MHCDHSTLTAQLWVPSQSRSWTPAEYVDEVGGIRKRLSWVTWLCFGLCWQRLSLPIPMAITYPSLSGAPQGTHAEAEVSWVKAYPPGCNGVRTGSQGAARASNKQGSPQGLEQKAGAVRMHAWLFCGSHSFCCMKGKGMCCDSVYTCLLLHSQLSMIQYVLSFNEVKKTKSSPLLKSAITTNIEYSEHLNKGFYMTKSLRDRPSQQIYHTKGNYRQAIHSTC